MAFETNIVAALFLSLCLNVVMCSWWDEDDYDYNPNIHDSYETHGSGRVIGPDGLAKIEFFPYMASIIIQSPSRTTEKFHCAGFQAPIEYTVIITAGSCIDFLIKNRIPVENVVVRTNSEVWTCSCGIGVEYQVLKWVVHPEYQMHMIPFVGTFSENDIGMIALNGTWTGVYNRNATMRLRVHFDNIDMSTRRGTVVGWGYSNFASLTVESYLRMDGNSKILTERQCRQFYRHYFPKNSFCLSTVLSDYSGPCAYDQGGPYLWFNESGWHSSGTISFVMGIISSAPHCSKESPAIILNISHYTDFIYNDSWLIPDSEATTPSWIWPGPDPAYSWWKPGPNVDLGWFRG